jgi:microcystin-dependent protein
MSSQPFVAEICLFPFNFAPTGWAMCNGQILAVASNTEVFSLLGTTYGGNGSTTFALPNLQGCVPIHAGQGPGLGLYDLGETGGEANHLLVQNEIPQHTHSIQTDGNHLHDTLTSPSGALLVNGSPNLTFSNGNTQTTIVGMSPSMVGVSGGNTAHNNMMPYLTLNYCIALQGVYPPRS